MQLKQTHGGGGMHQSLMLSGLGPMLTKVQCSHSLLMIFRFINLSINGLRPMTRSVIHNGMIAYPC
jgi:hypothetical protein